MSSQLYPAEEVEGILGTLLEGMEGALATAKAAAAETASLRVQLDDHKIRLEKVASSSPFQQELVESVVAALADHGLCDAQSQVKLAAELLEDPNNALRLARRLLQLSEAPPIQGQGLPKTAHASTDKDPDNWAELGRIGA